MQDKLKKIDYVEVLKNAWKLTWKNRFLWWFGFFVSLGSGMSSFNFNLPGNSEQKEDISPEVMEDIGYYWSLYKEWIIFALVVIFLIIITLYVLGIVGRGGLISAVFKVDEGKKTNFSLEFKNANKFFWKLLFLNIIIGISLILVILILFSPVARLLFLEAYGPAFLLGVVAAPISISVFILSAFLKIYSQIYVVREKVAVADSLKLSYNLLKRNIKKSLIMGFLLAVVGIIAGVALLTAYLILSIPFIILGLAGHFLVGSVWTVMIVVVAAVVVICFSLFWKSIFAVFVQTAWIMFFKKIATVHIVNSEKKLKEDSVERVSKLRKVPE